MTLLDNQVYNARSQVTIKKRYGPKVYLVHEIFQRIFQVFSLLSFDSLSTSFCKCGVILGKDRY